MFAPAAPPPPPLLGRVLRLADYTSPRIMTRLLASGAQVRRRIGFVWAMGQGVAVLLAPATAVASLRVRFSNAMGFRFKVRYVGIRGQVLRTRTSEVMIELEQSDAFALN